MNAKELLQKIKQLFEMPMEPAIEVKTQDGMELKVTKLEVGGMAMINGAAAPANTYVLEDGTSLIVDAMGMITAITPATPAAPAEAAAPPVAPPPVQLAAEPKTPEEIRALYSKFSVGTVEERIANLEIIAKAVVENIFSERESEQAAFAAYKAATDKTLSALQTKATLQAEGMKQAIALMEQMAGAPVADPPAETKKKFSFSNMEAKKKSFARFAEAAKKIATEMNTAEN